MRAAEPLSAVMEDYLEAVYLLSEKDENVHAGDIASRVDVHKSTATAALHALADHKLIEYEPYKPVHLTRRGKHLGALIARRHRALRRFLTEVLGIDASTAEETACRMEHVVPPEVIERFAAFADFVENCPRADARFAEGLGYLCEDADREPGCAHCGAGVPGAWENEP